MTRYGCRDGASEEAEAPEPTKPAETLRLRDSGVVLRKTKKKKDKGESERMMMFMMMMNKVSVYEMW